MTFHRPKRIHLIAALLALTLIILGVTIVIRPIMAERGLLSMLERAGWITASVGKTDFPGGTTVFETISLSGADKIARITLKPEQAGRSIIIDGAALSGTWSSATGISSDGWVRPASLKSLTRVMAKHDITTIIINDAQIDATLPVLGRSLLKAKGQITMNPADETLRLHLTLWGVEGALTMQTGITGEITPGGLASIDVEVMEGKIAAPGLSVARMGGWVIFNRDNATTPWNTSAQLVAGLAEYLGLPLNNLTFSAAGSSEEMSFTLQSGKDDHDTALLSVDGRAGTVTQNTLGITLQLPARDLLLRIQSAPDKPSDLLRAMNVALYDVSGRQWMNGNLRRVETGYELDIVSAWVPEAMNVLKLDEFKAGGTLTGLLPLSIGESGNLVIEEGLLRSAGNGGTISTSAKSLPATLQPTRRDALNLLKSFQYNALEIYLSGPVNLGLEGDITLRGRTPGRNSGDAELKLHFRDFVVQ